MYILFVYTHNVKDVLPYENLFPNKVRNIYGVRRVLNSIPSNLENHRTKHRRILQSFTWRLFHHAHHRRRLHDSIEHSQLSVYILMRTLYHNVVLFIKGRWEEYMTRYEAFTVRQKGMMEH